MSTLIGCWSGFTGKITLTLPPQLLLPTTNLLQDSEKSEDQPRPGSERQTGSQPLRAPACDSGPEGNQLRTSDGDHNVVIP